MHPGRTGTLNHAQANATRMVHAHGDRAGWRDIRAWRALPALSIHLGCLGVFWVGWSWTAVGLALAAYIVRMFAITGAYHRYFSHRTFRTSRVMQLVFALVGASAAQRGPLWWAAHHRDHHRHSDDECDKHSPARQGVLWSHFGWFLAEPNIPTNVKSVPDLMRFPELRWVDRYHMVPVLGLLALMYGLGWILSVAAPELGADGPQVAVWGFFVSTTVLYHVTFTINSLAHTIGTRRFRTRDDSRNNLLLAIVTFGEGWHNNHHYYPGSARQGLYWWEVDLTYALLRVLAAARIIWDLRPAPASVYAAARAHRALPDRHASERRSAS